MNYEPTGGFEPAAVVYAERPDLRPVPLSPSEPSPVGTEADRVRAADRQAAALFRSGYGTGYADAKAGNEPKPPYPDGDERTPAYYRGYADRGKEVRRFRTDEAFRDGLDDKTFRNLAEASMNDFLNRKS